MTSLLIQAALCEAKSNKFYNATEKLLARHLAHSGSRSRTNGSEGKIRDSIVVGGARNGDRLEEDDDDSDENNDEDSDEDEFMDMEYEDLEVAENVLITEDDDNSIVCTTNGNGNAHRTLDGDVIVCAPPDSPSTMSMFSRSPSSDTLSASSNTDGSIRPDDSVLRALFQCSSCYRALLDIYLTQFLTPRPTYYNEWYTSVERPFVADLSKLTALAKDYRLHPEDIDARVDKEKRRWYVENLKALRLRLLMEGDPGKDALLGLLAEVAAGRGNLDELIDQVSETLRNLGTDEWPEEVPDKLLAAENRDQKVGVLKDAFLVSINHKGYREVPRDHKKYVKMMEDGESMEYVIDKILEENQKAVRARESLATTKKRLEELRRARAAHELQKKRKAQARELALKNKVPDDMYDLPPCAACGEKPNPRRFKACAICTLLVGNGVYGQKKTVFCSTECEKKGYPAHAATHKCASGTGCLHGRLTRTKSKSHLRPGARPRNRPPPAPPLFRQAVTASAAPGGANAMPIRGANGSVPPAYPQHNHRPNPNFHAHNHYPLNPNNPHNHKGSLRNSMNGMPLESPGAPAPPPGPRDMRFCKECLSQKKQTIFCCEACACQNYRRHCVEAHPNSRFARGIIGPNGPGDARDPDILKLFTTSYDHAAREWESKYHVSLRRQ